MIYLDYSANTPADPAALAAFCKTEQTCIGNPNSAHPAGRAAKKDLERITVSISGLLGVLPDELIFTSGASESNNLAIKGIAQASWHTGRHIISTALEHASVGGALTALQNQGWEIDLLDIQPDGTVDLEQLSELLRKDTVLVAVSAVDSELGPVQPIREIAGILKRHPDCKLHVDAAQAVGKIPLALDGVDTLTPALALAASTETALRLAVEKQRERVAYVTELNTKLRAALARYPAVRINSPENAVPHILNLSVKDVKGVVFQQKLAEHGVCVSVKSACSVEGTPSKAVFAVSRDRKNALSSWRISLSHLTTGEELDEFLNIFDQCYKTLVS